MPKGVRVTSNQASIDSRRAQLEAELASLNEAEKKLSEVERDAGRDGLLAALGRVKIAAMDKASSRIIAKAIEAEGGDAIAGRIGTQTAASKVN